MFSPATLLTGEARSGFGTILADPPWQFQDRTGKVASEHWRLNRYGTMTLDDIRAMPVADVAAWPSRPRRSETRDGLLSAGLVVSRHNRTTVSLPVIPA